MPLVVALVLSTLGMVILLRTSPLSAFELVNWLLQGPLSVVGAQCFTVLAVLAVIRWRVRIPGKQPTKNGVSTLSL
jgi:hypothetical protein